MTPAAATRSLPYPLGVTLRHDGANVAIYSETADAVDFCVFDDARRARPGPTLPERTGHVFHGLVDGVGVGHPLRPARRRRLEPRRRAAPQRATSCCSTRTPPPSRAATTGAEAVFGHDLERPAPQFDSADSGPVHPALRRHRSGASTGTSDARRRAADPAGRHGRLRGPREGLHPAAPRRARRRSAAPTPAWPTRRPSSTSPISASPPSNCCPVHQFVQDATWSRRACATTGATTPSASSPRTADYSAAGTAAARSPSSRRWSRRSTRPASR